MPSSHWYQKAVRNILQREATNAIDLDGDTIKLMLTKTSYTSVAAKGDAFVNTITDPTSKELVATNYTGGFSGAGRKTLAAKAINEDTTNNRAVFDASDVTWTAIGGATNDTIGSAVVIKEITNDGASPLLIHLYINPAVTTNGGDFTIVFADGLTQGIGYSQI